MNVYLSGGMRGRPAEIIELLFKTGAAKLRRKGHDVFSPLEQDALEGLTAEHATSESVDDRLTRKLFKQDCIWICDNADAIALLPGWESSSGARAERALAEALRSVEIWTPETWWYDEPSVDGADMQRHLNMRNLEWSRAEKRYVG